MLSAADPPDLSMVSVLPDVVICLLLGGSLEAGVRGCPFACVRGTGALLSLLEMSVCLQLVVWWDKQRPTGSGAFVPAAIPAMPKQAAGLIALLAGLC